MGFGGCTQYCEEEAAGGYPVFNPNACLGANQVGCCGFSIDAVCCTGCGGGGGFCFCQCSGVSCGFSCCIGPVSGSPAGSLARCDCFLGCCGGHSFDGVSNCYCGETLGSNCTPTCGGPDRGGSVYCSDTGVTTPAPCSDVCALLCEALNCGCCCNNKGAGSAAPTKAGSAGGGSGSGGGGKPSGGAQKQQQNGAQQAQLTQLLGKLGNTVTQMAKGFTSTTKAILGQAKTGVASSTTSGDMTIIIIIVLLIAAGLFFSKESE